MRTRFALGLVSVFTLVAFAGAADIALSNPGFEDGEAGYHAHAPGWDGNIADYDHSLTGLTTPAELGAKFGFLGSGDPWGGFQRTGVIIQEGYTYTFDSYVLVRNNGALPLGIGYVDAEDAEQVLATELYGNTYTEWTHVDGVSWTATAGSPAIGMELVVGYAGGPSGLNEGDAWFDNAAASVVPEPASLLLLAGLLVFRRR